MSDKYVTGTKLGIMGKIINETHSLPIKSFISLKHFSGEYKLILSVKMKCSGEYSLFKCKFLYRNTQEVILS